MAQKKQGFPEENEIVLCTVKKILPHGIFVSLDEYESKEGLIHISEISPGRVRNIRDFVKEGKRIVCKILRMSRERNHIDLSLRRVNQAQRINKNIEYKQEQKAEKILEVTGKELKLPLEDLYKKVGDKLIENYGSLYNGFEEMSENNDLLKDLNLDKKIESTLLKFIKERIKKREIKLSASLTLSSINSKGIEIIKATLKALEDKHSNIKIKYIGAPKYQLTLIADNYKIAEKQLTNIQQEGFKLMKNQGVFKLERNDKKHT
jgi:translation initiation factor 2 subunit 1|tara:strand:+ start:15338 stop:16126 length:789 start_codon:yes stop_codon:yes gene_type:complete